jgi:defect-in-organelle-trafficking protein DotC
MAAAITIMLLSGCASPAINAGTGSLTQLEHIGVRSHLHGYAVNTIRFTALKDIALSLGAQAGLAWRARQIDFILNRDDKKLYRAYDFYSMLLDHNIIPPVLVEADSPLSLDGPDTIRLAQKIYKIKRQAHFVTAPPTWRDYLWMDFRQPGVPDNTLLPRNRTEQKIWDHYVTMGWFNGIQQANSIFHADLSRLNQDYKGMILYRKLFSENMVSAPFVAKTDLGITGNSSHMTIGDQILRITALPQLNLEGQTWKPAIIPSDTGKNTVIYGPRELLAPPPPEAEPPADSPHGEELLIKK